MATFANCRSAYISRVLQGQADLSFERAESVSRFLHHFRRRNRLFMLLMQYARAGTPRLRARILKKITKMVELSQKLTNRVDIKKNISNEHQEIYYSSWMCAAVHILVTIPAFQSLEKIAAYLHAPKDKIVEVVNFLISAGILEKKGNRLNATETRFFLRSDSPLIGQHHANWRLKAISSMGIAQPSDIHLSTVFSLSRKDVAKIREKMLQFIRSDPSHRERIEGRRSIFVLSRFF